MTNDPIDSPASSASGVQSSGTPAELSPENPERPPDQRALDDDAVDLAKKRLIAAFGDLDPRKYMRANPGTTLTASAVAGIVAGLATRADSASLARSVKFATELASPLVAQIAAGFTAAAAARAAAKPDPAPAEGRAAADTAPEAPRVT